MTALAFYDLDGTLVSSNVVDQYLWFARQAGWTRIARALARAPKWILAERKSRRLFNEIFYREYARLPEDWLRNRAGRMHEAVIRPALFPGAAGLVKRDRAAGYRTVLVTGSLDFCVQPLAAQFQFDEVIANRLEFRDGVSTGALLPPIIAEQEKVQTIREMLEKYNVESGLCKAYSDSYSDTPMLEAVGLPAAVHPDGRLRELAQRRGWPIVNLKESDHADVR